MALPYRHTQRSSVLPVILAVTTGFVVLGVFIGLALEQPTIIAETPGATKVVLPLFIFALTIGMSILSWYFSSMTVEVTDGELRWRFAGSRSSTPRRRHRENRAAQALIPPFRLMNCSSGSESGLYTAAYRMTRDHLLRVRLSALAGSAVHRMIEA